MYTYEYPRPAVAVDVVVVRQTHDDLLVLLIRRKHEPFQNQWALPGGFMNIDETLEQAAIRELREETGVTAQKLVQLGAWSAVDRDPRDRVISVAFLTEVNDEFANAADDASEVTWLSVDDLPDLAFDHNDMVAQGVKCHIAGRI